MLYWYTFLPVINIFIALAFAMFMAEKLFSIKLKGSTLPFDVIFSIGLILIMFIAVAIVIHMLVGSLSNSACIDGQTTNIMDINDIAEDVNFMGGGLIQIAKFKILSCVQCVAFDSSTNKLKVKYVTQGATEEPKTFDTPSVWNGIDDWEGIGKDCKNATISIGGKTCTLEIKYMVIDASCS